MTDLYLRLDDIQQKIGDLENWDDWGDMDRVIEAMSSVVSDAELMVTALRRAINALKGVEGLSGKYTRAYGPDDNGSRVADLLTMDTYQLGAQGLDSIRDALELTDE